MTAVTEHEGAPSTIAGHLRPFGGRIGLAYGLTMIETLFELLYPFAAGLAIDGLLSGDGWAALLPLERDPLRSSRSER